MIKKLASVTIIQFISRITSVIQVLLLTKILPIEIFSDYILLSSISLIFVVFSSGGINEFIIKELSFCKGNTQKHRLVTKTHIAYTLIFALFLCIYLIVCKAIYTDRFNFHILIVIAGIVYFRGICVIEVAVNTSYGHVLKSQLFNTLVPSVLLLLFIIAMYIYPGFRISILYLLYSQLFIWFIIASYFVFNKQYKFNFRNTVNERLRVKIIPQFYRFRGYYLLAIVGVFSVEFANIVIDGYAEQGSVALYRVAFLAQSLLPLALTASIAYLNPLIANNLDDVKFLQVEISKAVNIIFFIMLPVIVISMTYSDRVVIMFLGEQYLDSSNLYRIMAIGQLVNIFCGVPGVLLVMTGNQMYMVKFSLLVSVLSIVLLCCLVPSYGVTGAAISATVILILQNVILCKYSYRKTGLVSWVRLNSPQ